MRTYDDMVTDTAEIEVTLRGNVGTLIGAYAKSKLAHALLFAHRPVRRVHVVMDYHHDPAVERPANVDVVVDVGGVIVHAEADAPTMRDAVDDVERRLRGQLQTLHGRALSRRHTGEGRSGSIPVPPQRG